MTERINRNNLANAFVRYCTAAKRLGYDTTDWRLSIGSKTQGIWYQAGITRDAAVRLPGTVGNGKVGETAREAYETLQTISQTLDDVARQMGLTD